MAAPNEIKHVSSQNEALEKLGGGFDLHRVNDVKVACTSDDQSRVFLALSFRHQLEGDGTEIRPRDKEEVQVWDRDDLVGFAKLILRELAPTVQDEMLAALKRIEARLPETEQSPQS